MQYEKQMALSHLDLHGICVSTLKVVHTVCLYPLHLSIRIACEENAAGCLRRPRNAWPVK